ncbi:NAD(P)-dependent oxidoreductase [Lipingzhangella sp. LS1_29]|uniref:NAD(P)-dependent oxidoreductase n=1 Tax=Lipingzhangella rawalii TaxID=2055835 RepID=A0ABU2H8F3_9ACTN|nr:NAD(P)-dependent oxidoreductase [Lipingzhangella rawalii]MDS1271586.1 NAD(P)-dependent oxidoreductase [Lipingzhangella rawalii]
MRILLADAFPDASRAELAQRGHDCRYEPTVTTEDLPQMVPGCEALVVRSTRVPAAVLAAADSLRLIVRAGSGTNTIDCAEAARRGVYVCNVPGRNAAAVAELALGLLLAIDRRIPDNVTDLRQGRWNKKLYSQARGIQGRAIGILGLGSIGLAFAHRAAAFGADIYAVAKANRDPATLDAAQAAGITFLDSAATLAATCDVLSVHVPGGESTRGLVSQDLLAQMQPGAILLNTSRGDVVDEAALIEAMDSKGVRAGLDVFQEEPAAGTGAIDSTLARHPNVYGTHHIGASTAQAQQAVADGVVEIVEQFGAGTLLHCVNRPLESATAPVDSVT